MFRESRRHNHEWGLTLLQHNVAKQMQSHVKVPEMIEVLVEEKDWFDSADDDPVTKQVARVKMLRWDRFCGGGHCVGEALC